MNEQIIKDKILLATLTHVPFDGWTQQALRRGLADTGQSKDAAHGFFPGGLRELAGYFSAYIDRCMLEKLEQSNLADQRVRDRIACAVRTRLQILAPHREAVRRFSAYMALPTNAPFATRLTYQTVNAMWYAAGDNAADFNFYTKRALLGAVYTSTVLYWLNDSSEGFSKTWSFLDRRISGVMKIPGYSSRAKKVLSNLPTPWGVARALRNSFRRFKPDL